jgi:hypothetical protein
MGTRSHTPDTGKPATFGQTGHAHDGDTKALGPGVRPGTRSRVLEARERAAKRGPPL